MASTASDPITNIVPKASEGVLPDRNLLSPAFQAIGDELVVYLPGSASAHSLNGTSAFVYLQCDGQRKEEEVAHEVKTRFELSNDEDALSLVRQVVHALCLEGLLLSSIGSEGSQSSGASESGGDCVEAGLDRRRFLTAAGAAVAAPLIASVLLPRPAAAQSVCPTCVDCSECGDYCNGTPPDCGQIAPGVPTTTVANICNFEMRIAGAATPVPGKPLAADPTVATSCRDEFTGGSFLCRATNNPGLRFHADCLTARNQIIAFYGIDNSRNQLYYCCSCASNTNPSGPRC